MKTRTLIAAAVGLALALGGPASLALADDAPPPTPAPVISTPDPTTTPAPDDPTITTPTPTVAAVAPDVAVNTYTAVIWSMPSWVNSTTPTWSQTEVSATPEATESFVPFPTTCGTQYQQDIYLTGDVTSSLLTGGPGFAKLNGPNNPPESFPAPSGWGVTYELHQNAACEPDPIACVAVPGWATEDTAPVVSSEGLLFNGPSATAIDYYQRVSAGNAQGITSLTVTYGAGGTGQPAQVVVEINPHTTLSFATLSTNLTAPSGTVNVLDPSVLWSTTKIPTGPGSLSDPIPYTALVALFPNNTLDSAPSLHLLTNSTSNDNSLVQAISSSCGSTSFVAVTTPPPVTPTPSVPKLAFTRGSIAWWLLGILPLSAAGAFMRFPALRGWVRNLIRRTA